MLSLLLAPVRLLALILFFIGINLATFGFSQQNFKCPPRKVEIRYIPRKIYDEQIYDQEISKKFEKMFDTNKLSRDLLR